MLSSLEFNYLTLMLLKNRSRYFSLFVISILVIFLLSSILFTGSSIKETLLQNLKNQPDFIVQRVRAGSSTTTPKSWQDKIVQIPGVGEITQRVYGRYLLNNSKSILIIGVDFFDELNNKNLKNIINNLNLKEFLKEDSMIIGKGVSDYLKKGFYSNSYNFITPNGELKQVKIYRVLDKKSAFFSNDVAIMPIELASKILGINSSYVSDIALNIPNDTEKTTVKEKIESLFYNVRVVTKEQIKEAYINLYDYKSGIFLTMFVITLSTFTLILYLRYTITTSVERREIGIFRAVGWSIKDILRVKFFENIAFILFVYIIGVSLAYIYVFIFNAPLLIDIFLNNENLKNFTQLQSVIDYGVLASIFIIFAISFLSTTLIPIWKIAIIDPKEAML